MYQGLYYAGIVLTVACFITAVILFFRNRIPSVIQYFLHIAVKKRHRPSTLAYHTTQEISTGGNESTYLLDIEDEKTELLDIAQQYATALLEADSTTILPCLDEDETE